MTELQKSMRANYRRPLVTWKAFALVVLGFALHPIFTFFAHPLFRHQGRAGKAAAYDSQRQQLELSCNDTRLVLRRTEISHGIVQTIELQRLGNCGAVRLPSQKGEGYANYGYRDPGFVLPEQVPTYREATPQRILTIGRDLKAMPSE